MGTAAAERFSRLAGSLRGACLRAVPRSAALSYHAVVGRRAWLCERVVPR